jgi:hypothetical protein
MGGVGRGIKGIRLIAGRLNPSDTDVVVPGI